MMTIVLAKRATKGHATRYNLIYRYITLTRTDSVWLITASQHFSFVQMKVEYHLLLAMVKTRIQPEKSVWREADQLPITIMILSTDKCMPKANAC